MLDKVQNLRRQIKHQEVRERNEKIDSRISDLNTYEVKVTADASANTQNQIKRHLEMQGKLVIESLESIATVVNIAHRDNVPILATDAMIDAVFSKYKQQAEAEQQAKFDEFVKEREEETQKLIDQERM